MTSARDMFLKLFAMRKNQAFLTVKTRFGAAICALGLTILSTAVPAEARRAYSSYGDIDEKTLENILNGKSPAKKAARPKPKRRKPVSSAASSSASGDKAVNSSGSAATSAASSSSSNQSGNQSGNQSSSQSANPNAASFAALAPVPTLQKGSLKGLSKKLSVLVEMSPPTSLDMDKEQALSVGSK
ncbi:MAG: hypothetical protein IPJ49_24295 [Candidatus Obscuribacter sp.]|nr:hypothetical protein [Candidatus Obscuribacter sp.]